MYRIGKHVPNRLFWRKCLVSILLCYMVFADVTPLLQWPPALPELPVAEAADDVSIKIESFDQNVTTDGVYVYAPE